MTIEAALLALADGDSAVSSLIGARFTALKLPQDPTLPASVFTRLSTLRGRLLSGPDGRAAVDYRIDSYALTFEQARELADAWRALLDGYRGTAAGVAIGDVVCDAEQDLQEPNAAPGGATLYRVRQEFVFYHQE